MTAMATCPLVAILRGLSSKEAEPVGTALAHAGITIIEVPLNSPEPMTSIAALRRTLPDSVMIGAGTVTHVDQVDAVVAAGGQMIVSPNVDSAVIGRARKRGLAAVPGFQTPSEAFGALAAGATALKLFPAEAAGPTVLRALRAVLPRNTMVLPVGGIGEKHMATWLDAGADGFGLGSALYQPGDAAVVVADRARGFVAAVTAARAAGSRVP